MPAPSPVLLHQRAAPYRPSVPRPPKLFRIDSVTIEPLPPKGYLPTGPGTAVPSRFEAHFVVGAPEASVTIEVSVGADIRPVVVDMAIHAKVSTPITTSMLRQVLVEQLLQRAMTEATVPVEVRTEWLATLPGSVQDSARQAGSPPEPMLTAAERARAQFDADARTAARVYQEALAAGSPAPTMAVAHTMSRSRAQASRYIRRARELDLLPPM
jgi:hypothetical protein